jgi:hypothetical protein
VDDDTRAYVRDLIHTAAGHYARAVALLEEANRIAGGQTRDQPAHDYTPPPDLCRGGDSPSTPT